MFARVRQSSMTFFGIIFGGIFLFGGGFPSSIPKSTIESYFIGLSFFGLVFFSIMFLINLSNSLKNLELLSKYGLLATSVLSIIGLSIFGNSEWGLVCCPRGYTGGFYTIFFFLLILHFLNSTILVLIKK